MLDRMRTKEGAGNQKSMKMLMDKAIIKHLTVVVIMSVDSSFEDYKYKLESLCLHYIMFPKNAPLMRLHCLGVFFLGGYLED